MDARRVLLFPVLGIAVGSLFAIFSLSPSIPLAVPPWSFVPVGVILLVSFVLLIYTRRYLLVVLLTGLLVRLPYLTLRPVHDDSGFYYGIARDIVAGDLAFHGSIGVELFMAGFVAVFGEAGANLASFTASLATIPVVMVTAEHLFDSRRSGLGAGLITAVAPLHVWFSSWAYTEPVAILFFATALYFLAIERYGTALASAAVVMLMRLEYVILILFPLFFLMKSRERSLVLYYGFLGSTMAILVLFPLVAILFPDAASWAFFRFTELLGAGPLFSNTFLKTFFEDPLRVFTRNLVVYSSHFLHWGVPYWDEKLVNPALPLLTLVGLYTVLEHRRSSFLSLVSGIAVLTAGFVFKEFFLTGERGVIISGVSIFIAFVLVMLPLFIFGENFRKREIQPFLATLPYLVLLSMLYLAPRYLLPLVVVYSLYAGHGLAQIYGQITSGQGWTIRVRKPI